MKAMESVFYSHNVCLIKKVFHKREEKNAEKNENDLVERPKFDTYTTLI